MARFPSVVLALEAGLLAACSSGSPSSSPSGAAAPAATVTVTVTATASPPAASPTPSPTQANKPNSCSTAKQWEAAPCHFLNYVAGFETRPLTAGEKQLASTLTEKTRSSYVFGGCELVGDVTVECRYTVKGTTLALSVQPEGADAGFTPSPQTIYRVIDLTTS